MYQEMWEEEDLFALKTSLIHRFENKIENRGVRLFTTTRSNNNDTRLNRTTITRKQKWEVKHLYGRFKRLTRDISQDKIWKWLRKGNLKKERKP